MRISKRFKLNRGQGELDFVDVDDVGDTRLYVDPRALRLLPTEWGHECVSLIQNFFRAVLKEIKNENDQEAIRLLGGLIEPNETRLGLSKKEARGTGLGPQLAIATFESLQKSEAAKSGLLKDLEDTALMVERIGLDRVSDIATNIIRRPLIQYTQDAANYYGIPTKEEVAAGAIWDPKLRDWKSGFADLPVTKRGPLILVPKAIVRRQLDYNQSEYFTHYVLPYMQQVELNAKSSLVTLLKDGTPRVYKKTLKNHYGQGKGTIVRLTREHPEMLVCYHKDKKKRPQRPLDHLELADELGVEPPNFPALLSAIKAIPTGSDDATDYHRAVESLLSALFYPSLAHPDIEHEIQSSLSMTPICGRWSKPGVLSRAREATNCFASDLRALSRLCCASELMGSGTISLPKASPIVRNRAESEVARNLPSSQYRAEKLISSTSLRRESLYPAELSGLEGQA